MIDFIFIRFYSLTISARIASTQLHDHLFQCIADWCLIRASWISCVVLLLIIIVIWVWFLIPSCNYGSSFLTRLSAQIPRFLHSRRWISFTWFLLFLMTMFWLLTFLSFRTRMRCMVTIWGIWRWRSRWRWLRWWWRFWSTSAFWLMFTLMLFVLIHLLPPKEC